MIPQAITVPRSDNLLYKYARDNYVSLEASYRLYIQALILDLADHRMVVKQQEKEIQELSDKVVKFTNPPKTIPSHDPVNHPSHYTSHPSGIECIEITRHMNFNLGNATKYIWRAGLKNNQMEDLRKAAFYIQDEISRIEAENE